MEACFGKLEVEGSGGLEGDGYMGLAVAGGRLRSAAGADGALVLPLDGYCVPDEDEDGLNDGSDEILCVEVDGDTRE